MEDNTKKEKQIEWIQKNVLLLIELWQNYEFLYNPKHEFYSNKHARQDALNKICDELKKNMPRIECSDVKNKMNYLRGQYTRELAKIKIKNDMGTDEVPETSVYWFPQMHFIKEYVKCRKGKSNFNFETIVVEDALMDSKFDVSIESTLTSQSSLQRAKRRMETSTKKNQDDFLATALSAVSSLADATAKRSQAEATDSFTDNVNAFTNYINKELLVISNESLQDEIKFKISNLIYEYKVKQRELDFSY